jgi:beta-lactam-binding protein with PASTA domain
MAIIGVPPAARDGDVAASAPAAVRQTAQLELHVSMPVVAGRRRGVVAASLTNGGQAPVEARLSAHARDGRLRAEVLPSGVVLGPGEHCSVEVVLRPRRPRLLGGELEHPVTIEASCAAGAVARGVVFVQERLVAPWGWLVLLALIAAVAFGATRLPEHSVAVPSLVGAPDVASAARTLRAAGLRLDPQLRSRTQADAAPGSILDQIPGPGTRLRRGESVSLLVVVATRRAVTPVLDGLTVQQAAGVLRASGLTPGPVLPDGAAANAVVASQLPIAGQRVPAGTAVTVFARRGAAGRAGGARGAAGPAQDVQVPSPGTRSVREYARAVAGAGLVPVVVRAVDPAPQGSLVAVRPRAGTSLQAGDRVRLVVAAGVPRLAFDTGAVVRLFDPSTARTVREAAPPQGDAVEPAWTPDGRQVLYRVGRRLVLVSGRAGDRGRVVYDGRDKYTAAAFASGAPSPVLALVRRTGSDGDLCFAALAAGDVRPRCASDRRWDLGRQVAWRAGGRELLVFGVRRGHPGEFGMLRYRSERPFSTDPRDWHGSLATDASRNGRGVIGAAYAPDGSRVALVTNIALPGFQLLVTGAGDLRAPAARALPLRACEVAWRPDGGELAVVQSDAACSRPVGQIVRVDPRAPRRAVTVSSGGRHPAYQPLTYAGPRGVS